MARTRRSGKVIRRGTGPTTRSAVAEPWATSEDIENTIHGIPTRLIASLKHLEKSERRPVGLLHRHRIALFYKEAGKGDPPFVFIHGWCCDHSYFAPQFEHFEGIVLDLRRLQLDEEAVQVFYVSSDGASGRRARACLRRAPRARPRSTRPRSWYRRRLRRRAPSRFSPASGTPRQ